LELLPVCRHRGTCHLPFLCTAHCRSAAAARHHRCGAVVPRQRAAGLRLDPIAVDSTLSWFSLLQIDVEVEEPETSENRRSRLRFKVACPGTFKPATLRVCLISLPICRIRVLLKPMLQLELERYKGEGGPCYSQGFHLRQLFHASRFTFILLERYIRT
jgi:hypothetical protein